MRHQFEVVVPVGIVDDGPHPEGSACVGLGQELASQPTDSVRRQLVVATFVTVPVGLDDRGEVEPSHQLLEGLEALGDDGAWGDASCRRLFDGAGDEALDHALKRATLRLGPSGHVVHELGIKRSGLTSASLEPTVGAEIGVDGDQLLLECDRADQHHEEGLA